ncbi:hypothetical protein HAX54_016658 [Datura stramonium]|uniref:Uncharacterized protein n=1 Tax=Datura stramonium TaxID=4076 RepID=A0ABS8UKW9_DATST|nr:hypothetical protein [Datura stramonium]
MKMKKRLSLASHRRFVGVHPWAVDLSYLVCSELQSISALASVVCRMLFHEPPVAIVHHPSGCLRSDSISPVSSGGALVSN